MPTVTQIRHFIPLFYNLFNAFAIIYTLLEYNLLNTLRWFHQFYTIFTTLLQFTSHFYN